MITHLFVFGVHAALMVLGILFGFIVSVVLFIVLFMLIAYVAGFFLESSNEASFQDRTSRIVSEVARAEADIERIDQLAEQSMRRGAPPFESSRVRPPPFP